MSRARRPTFMPSDAQSLLKALGDARRLAIQCASAECSNTPLRASAEAFHAALDDFAGQLTGNREFFWATPHGGAWVKPS
jgi:hypothetical protein